MKKGTIIIVLILMILIPLKSKAIVTSSDFNNIYGSGFINYLGGTTENIQFTKEIFKGRGEGEVIFSMWTAPYGANNTYPLISVTVGNNQSIYACDIGDTQWYYDNYTQKNVHTVKCKVDTTNEGLKYMQVFAPSMTGGISIKLSQYITFASTENEASAIIQAINTATNNVIAYMNSNTAQIHADIQNQTTSIETAINQIIEEITENQDDNWQEFMNEDISNQTKAPPNTTDYNTTNTNEQNVYNYVDTNADFNIVQFYNTGAWAWVLNRMTEFLQTNLKVFNMVISILSIGVLKCLLGR